MTFLCILPGLLLLGFNPLNDAIKTAGYEIVLSQWILVPLFLIFALYAAGIIFHITQYTDEFLPLQLYFAGIVTSLLGVWIFSRLLILGIIVMILSAYWSRTTMYQYYRQR